MAGEATTWRLELVNRTSAPLGTVPPRPLKVAAAGSGCPRATDEPAADDAPVAVGPQTPIARVVPPGMRTDVDVMVEVPDEPGRYQVRVALRQPGVGWFGVRVQGEVTVKPRRLDHHVGQSATRGGGWGTGRRRGSTACPSAA